MYIMGVLLKHGSEEQNLKYLPSIANGTTRLQAFAVTEPNSGSDTAAIKTYADKSTDGYVVNGQKLWTSRALHTDLMLLLARTSPIDLDEKRTAGLSVFLIDIRQAMDDGDSICIRPIDSMINHNTTEIFFNNLSTSLIIGVKY